MQFPGYPVGLQRRHDKGKPDASPGRKATGPSRAAELPNVDRPTLRDRRPRSAAEPATVSPRTEDRGSDGNNRSSSALPDRGRLRPAPGRFSSASRPRPPGSRQIHQLPCLVTTTLRLSRASPWGRHALSRGEGSMGTAQDQETSRRSTASARGDVGWRANVWGHGRPLRGGADPGPPWGRRVRVSCLRNRATSGGWGPFRRIRTSVRRFPSFGTQGGRT